MDARALLLIARGPTRTVRRAEHPLLSRPWNQLPDSKEPGSRLIMASPPPFFFPFTLTWPFGVENVNPFGEPGSSPVFGSRPNGSCGFRFFLARFFFAIRRPDEAQPHDGPAAQ